MMLAPWPTASVQSMDMEGVGVDLDRHARTSSRRKRKADLPPENNERLSKRLSLLNLEQNGTKLYIPVENPLASSSLLPPPSGHAPATSHGFPLSSVGHEGAAVASAPVDDDTMQVDDTKYKVYIYNIEDELSSESEPEDGNGKLVFLPDIEKHLKANRIPPQLLVDPRAEAAGKELVLYGVPRSISVPEGSDSVRKAIIEARARARDKQKEAQARTQGSTDEELMTLMPNADALVGCTGLAAPMPSVECLEVNVGSSSMHSDPKTLDMAGSMGAGVEDEMELD